MSATAAPPGPAFVERILAADAALAREALLAELPSGGPRAELYDLVADYPTRPGKGIRPALCLASCRAHGGRSEDALGVATAIEMLHNAFLVHDDICDEATLRRGEEALHVRHGVPLALNAGDALGWLALGPMLESADRLGSQLALELLGELRRTLRRTTEGQARELGWRKRDLRELDRAAYLELVRDKTCWYTAIFPCRAAVLIASGGRDDPGPIGRFGFFAGALLQVRDDVENVTDRDSDHGKDFGSDVIEGKPTLLVARLLELLGGAERERVLGLIGPPGERSGVAPAERIGEVVDLMESHDVVDWACEFADGLAGAALIELERATAHLPQSEDLEFLRSLVLYLRDPLIRGR